MKSLKIIIAAMLLLCLAPMPYGYYMLVRWAAMVVFAVTAFNYYAENKKELAVTFGALALLFQPFIKIALGRTIWNIVDVAVAILLLVLTFTKNKKENPAFGMDCSLSPTSSGVGLAMLCTKQTIIPTLTTCGGGLLP